MKKTFGLGLLLLVAGVIGMVITFSGDDDVWAFGTEQVDMGETVSAKGIENLQVKGRSVNVEVVRGSGSDILVALEGRLSEKFRDDVDLKVKSNGNTLEIEPTMPRGFTFGISIIDVKLRVELPEQKWEQFNIDVGSGNVKVSDVAAGDFLVHAGSGNIAVNGVEASVVEIRTGSGNQKLSSMKAGESILMELGSGDATIDRFQAKRLTFDANSGNVKLLDGDAKVEGSVGSGNIRYEAARIASDVRLKSGSGNVQIELDEKPESMRVDFRTGSGDSDIDFDGIRYDSKEEGDVSGQFGDGAVLLQVSTGSGNIDLEQR